MEERVNFSSGPLELEGIFAAPEGRPIVGGMVISHPHPQYGGDMYNNVVMALQSAAVDVDFASLRFNFRGVGLSQGSYGGGAGETEDVTAALLYLKTRLGQEADEIVVSGYSFGAYAGSRAAVKNKAVTSLILVSPPVELMDFTHLKGAAQRVLFISGDRDPFCPLPSLELFRSGLSAENSLLIVHGADHFYFGLDGYITRYATQFLRPGTSSGP